MSEMIEFYKWLDFMKQINDNDLLQACYDRGPCPGAQF